MQAISPFLFERIVCLARKSAFLLNPKQGNGRNAIPAELPA